MLAGACYEGMYEVVTRLLANPKIDPNIKDTNGRPPIFWAAGKCNLKTLEVMLASPNVDLDVKCGKGMGLEEVVGELRSEWEARNKTAKKICKEMIQKEKRKRRSPERKEEKQEKEKEEKHKKEKKRKSDLAKFFSEQKRMYEKKEEEARKAEAKRKREHDEKKKKQDEKKDLERIELETIRKRQEEKNLKDQRRGDPKEENIAQFQNSCKDASTCLAVCRFENCKQVQASAHIVPSYNCLSITL